MENVGAFFGIMFSVVWGVLNIQIPLGGSIFITPWAVILFSLTAAMVLRYIFKRGKDE